MCFIINNLLFVYLLTVAYWCRKPFADITMVPILAPPWFWTSCLLFMLVCPQFSLQHKSCSHCKIKTDLNISIRGTNSACICCCTMVASWLMSVFLLLSQWKPGLHLWYYKHNRLCKAFCVLKAFPRKLLFLNLLQATFGEASNQRNESPPISLSRDISLRQKSPQESSNASSRPVSAEVSKDL